MIGKRRFYFSCKISNDETVNEIEISFEKKDIKCLKFLFIYYMVDHIHRDRDWELFGSLFCGKRGEIQST